MTAIARHRVQTAVRCEHTFARTAPPLLPNERLPAAASAARRRRRTAARRLLTVIAAGRLSFGAATRGRRSLWRCVRPIRRRVFELVGVGHGDSLIRWDGYQIRRRRSRMDALTVGSSRGKWFVPGPCTQGVLRFRWTTTDSTCDVQRSPETYSRSPSSTPHRSATGRRLKSRCRPS